jgi:hypothetical protein
MSRFPFIAALTIIAVGVVVLLVGVVQSQSDSRSVPTNMRWGLWTTVVLIVLLVAYFAWPLVGFYSLASAVESRNAAALAERVDFPSLRRSLSQQVIAEYPAKIRNWAALELALPAASVPRLLSLLWLNFSTQKLSWIF